MTNLNDYTTTPKVFLTDYNSYNSGTQFEFGHWVELDQFSDENDFFEYVRNHFEEADKKSPIGGDPSEIREEIMLTDYEGFPSTFYCESAGSMEDLFSYLNLDDDDKIKMEYSTGHLGNDFKTALDTLEDLYLHEEYTDLKYDLFDEFFPEVEEQSGKCDFLSIDYDQFLQVYFNEFEAENGKTYFFPSY